MRMSWHRNNVQIIFSMATVHSSNDSSKKHRRTQLSGGVSKNGILISGDQINSELDSLPQRDDNFRVDKGRGICLSSSSGGCWAVFAPINTPKLALPGLRGLNGPPK